MKKNITKTIMSSIIISGLMIGAYAPIAEDVEKTILKEHFYDKEGYEKIIVRKDFFNSEKGAISSCRYSNDSII